MAQQIEGATNALHVTDFTRTEGTFPGPEEFSVPLVETSTRRGGFGKVLYVDGYNGGTSAESAWGHYDYYGDGGDHS